MQIFVSAILWLLLGAVSSYYAQIRGRDPLSWFFLGVLLGVLGPIILYFLPPLDPKAAPSGTEDFESDKEAPAQSVRFKEWYYLDKANSQQGPITFLALERLLDQGALSKASLVWCEGMQNWQPVSSVAELV
jgi:hypothetical protein